MGVFIFGDPSNRRPAWIVAPWPKRRRVGSVVRTGSNPAGKPVESTPADSGPRVLVVDDNPVHRMSASEMLALWGINPLLAVDDSEAVALACDLHLDLILMDLQMPVLDGLGATRQIRCMEVERARPRVPIVAYNSTDFGTDRFRPQEFGLDGMLAKPSKAHEQTQATHHHWASPQGVRPRKWCKSSAAWQDA